MERIERVKPKPESAQAELKPAPEQAVDNVMNPDDTVDTAGKELETTATLYNKEDETIPQDNTDKEAAEKKPFYMAAKTNLLYDAALVPNVGLEVYLSGGWSVGGDWMTHGGARIQSTAIGASTAVSWKCASTSEVRRPRSLCKDIMWACTRRG